MEGKIVVEADVKREAKLNSSQDTCMSRGEAQLSLILHLLTATRDCYQLAYLVPYLLP